MNSEVFLNDRAATRWLEFGEFRLDTYARVLWRGSRIVAIPPKALDTLLALVRRNGQVALKTELMNEVWPDAYVEEAGLAHNICVLRKALGPTGRLIKTVPKRGYRFAGRVQPLAESPAADAMLSQDEDGQNAAERLQTVALGWCAGCERHVWIASVEQAASVTGTREALLMSLVDTGRVHTQTTTGGIRLCMPSLIEALAD